MASLLKIIAVGETFAEDFALQWAADHGVSWCRSCLEPKVASNVDRTEAGTQPVALKLDPGANVTGLAIVRQDQRDPSKQIVLHLAEVSHLGKTILKRMTQRAMYRRRRRNANLRYRAPRFDNRTRPEGRLPPSLQTRVDNITSLVSRYLVGRLRQTGLPIFTGSGGRTKFNRQTLGLPKTHALDAACVGAVSSLKAWDMQSLRIKATGRGSYQRTRPDSRGFPRGYLTRTKTIHGFRTGDLVKAVVSTGKKAGTHMGRVAVRASGSFNIQTENGTIQGINWRHFRQVMRDDGYTYTQQTAAIPPTTKAVGFLA